MWITKGKLYLYEFELSMDWSSTSSSSSFYHAFFGGPLTSKYDEWTHENPDLNDIPIDFIA